MGLQAELLRGLDEAAFGLRVEDSSFSFVSSSCPNLYFLANTATAGLLGWHAWLVGQALLVVIIYQAGQLESLLFTTSLQALIALDGQWRWWSIVQESQKRGGFFFA